MSAGTKNMLYAIAGVGALVSAALVYSWAIGADDEEVQEDDVLELL
eukprot:CAMPEP_0116881362 /NCGR_PEP_ID=MMETSP0463-20121206/13481_1 /TAXON_ID=181622 /ORGANISM="Strombidinopsis sp, Strain SopsisLIS2011" /LENGTH=45 /DNA_ID= /DNA_START= /DNA_END= /DNA_ORIENTATION=